MEGGEGAVEGTLIHEIAHTAGCKKEDYPTKVGDDLPSQLFWSRLDPWTKRKLLEGGTHLNRTLDDYYPDYLSDEIYLDEYGGQPNPPDAM